LAPALLAKTFADAQLPVIFTSDCLDPSRPQVWQTLVEVDGFAAADDRRVQAVVDAFDGALTRIVSLGGYAVPIAAEELE